jgi:hypothetical protein
MSARGRGDAGLSSLSTSARNRRQGLSLLGREKADANFLAKVAPVVRVTCGCPFVASWLVREADVGTLCWAGCGKRWELAL